MIADVLNLEAKLEAAEETANTPYCDVEVDSTQDIFGIIYRVWRGTSVLGTFYRSPIDEMWVSEPFCCSDRSRYNTADEAQAAIIDAWAQVH